MTKPSIVAMLGWIMPAPLATPTMRPRLPPRVKVACVTFGPTSVVRMACESASMPPVERRVIASGSVSRTFLSGRTTPMTPVEAMKISSSLQRSSSAARERTRFAASCPALPVTAFAQPALTTTAFNLPPLFFSAAFDSVDRRGLEAVLREDSGSVRAVGRDDEPEVRPLLADAGADAGGEETFRESHDFCAACAAARTRSGAVPP